MCHKSNYYLGTALLISSQLPFEQRTFFIKCTGRLDQLFGLFRHYFAFSLHIEDFFHQSSF